VEFYYGLLKGSFGTPTAVAVESPFFGSARLGSPPFSRTARPHAQNLHESPNSNLVRAHCHL